MSGAIEFASLTPQEKAQTVVIMAAVVECCPNHAATDCDGCPRGTPGFDNCVAKAKAATQRLRDSLRTNVEKNRAKAPRLATFMIAVLDEAEGKSSSKTWLYVLLGVGAVALVGGGIYLATRKPKVANANRRRSRRRRRK